jgi:hypothetical protein
MKYILVGETHGTKECPEAFLKIIKKHEIKKVALEFPKKNNFKTKKEQNKNLLC